MKLATWKNHIYHSILMFSLLVCVSTSTNLLSLNAETIDNEIHTLLNTCLQDLSDPRTFSQFMDELIDHINTHIDYYRTKVATRKINKAPNEYIDSFIALCQRLKEYKSSFKIGFDLLPYISMLPKKTQTLLTRHLKECAKNLDERLKRAVT